MKKLALVLALLPATALADKSFTGDKNATWDCNKDPEVSISSSNATFTITGPCTSISTSGSKLKVTLESIDDLNINGDDNTFTIGTLGELTVNGNRNTVTYKKAKNGKAADVQDNGKKNAVAKEKPPAKK